jgi:hypothetical protein
MSEPQMVEALMRNRTSPWPGCGTGTVRISTVESPGRNAAVIVVVMSSFSGSQLSASSNYCEN